MANGNTNTGGYLAFPTFGGGGEGGGITQVKLPASQMRFPTSSYNPVRRAPEPTLKETIAPFLPMALEGIMGLFKDDPEMMTEDEFYDDTGGPLTDDNTLKGDQEDRQRRAEFLAYQLYGAPEEKDGFGFDDVLSMVIGSQMGRGAGDYAASSRAIDKAKETSRLTKQTNRSNFLTSKLKDVDNLQHKIFQNEATPGEPPRNAFVDPRGMVYIANDDKTGYINIENLEGDWIPAQENAFQHLNLIDVDKARQGYPDVRPAYFDKTTGLTMVKDPEHKDANERGFRVAGVNWIDHNVFANSGQTAVDIFQTPSHKELSKKDAEFSAREQAVGSFLNIANPTVTALKEAVKNPANAPTTFVASLATIGNSAFTNFQQIASLNGNRPVTEIFDPTSGRNMEQLYVALDGGDEDAINQATTNFEYQSGIDLKSIMGELSYNNVSVRANFLQMAYMAAAANGQTGRTLSDKDLEKHLAIIGYGASQDPETLYNNILRFGDNLVTGLDSEIQLGIPKNGFQRYDMENSYFQATITRFYDPPTTKNAEGGDVIDWLDYDAYTYKSFLDRSKGMRNIDEWIAHKGTYYKVRRIKGLSSGNTREEVDTGPQVEFDLGAVERAYNN